MHCFCQDYCLMENNAQESLDGHAIPTTPLLLHGSHWIRWCHYWTRRHSSRNSSSPAGLLACQPCFFIMNISSRGYPCTVRSKLNKFEHNWGGGVLYSEVQVEQLWTCPVGDSYIEREGEERGRVDACMVSSKALWVMVTWDSLWIEWQTLLKTLPSHIFISRR